MLPARFDRTNVLEEYCVCICVSVDVRVSVIVSVCMYIILDIRMCQ